MVMRRRRAWADTRFSFTSISTGGELSPTDLLAGLADTETKTVSRILVDLEVGLGALSEVEGTQVIDLGIGVCSAEAFAVGITAIPDPQSVGDYPQAGWVYVATKWVQQALPTGGTPTAMWRRSAVFQADLRGQRKVDRGVLFLRVANTNAEVTAQNVRLCGRIRALCLT